MKQEALKQGENSRERMVQGGNSALGNSVKLMIKKNGSVK